MAKSTYTKSDLSSACAYVKKQIIKKVKNNEISTISKNKVFDMIAKKVNLNSARTLWSCKHKDYLDNWYIKLIENINEIIEKNIKLDNINDEKLVENNTVRDLKKIIEEQSKALDIVRYENEKLRELLIGKFGDVDELLNEF